MPPRWRWPFRPLYRWRPIPRVIDAAFGVYIGRHPERGVRRLRSAVAETDQAVLDDPSVRAAVRDSYAEMLRGGSWGWAHDDWLAANASVPVEDVNVPVEVWRGADDNLVPGDAVDHLVNSLPKGRLRMVSGAGHLVSVSHARDVLASVSSRLEPTR